MRRRTDEHQRLSSGDHSDFLTIAAFAATVVGEGSLITHHLSR